jgi:hypothetical protein
MMTVINYYDVYLMKRIFFQMDQVAIGDVSSHHLLGAAIRVHAVGLLVRVGSLLPVPLGPHLSLSHPRPHLVYHGLGSVTHCSG